MMFQILLADRVTNLGYAFMLMGHKRLFYSRKFDMTILDRVRSRGVEVVIFYLSITLAHSYFDFTDIEKEVRHNEPLGYVTGYGPDDVNL